MASTRLILVSCDPVHFQMDLRKLSYHSSNPETFCAEGHPEPLFGVALQEEPELLKSHMGQPNATPKTGPCLIVQAAKLNHSCVRARLA